jgi:hypothetical protein
VSGIEIGFPAVVSTLGRVYRLWRGGGFAVGALPAGVLADGYGIRVATAVVAALTAASGLLAAARMDETHRPA